MIVVDILTLRAVHIIYMGVMHQSYSSSNCDQVGSYCTSSILLVFTDDLLQTIFIIVVGSICDLALLLLDS